MIKNKEVLMEKYQGFDIYYDKELERFVADKKKLAIHFEARTLFEIKGDIRDSKTVEINKEAIIKDGYFNKQLSKILILTMNKPNKTYRYEILENTENSYDVNKIKNDELEEVYPLSEHNLSVFDGVKALERIITETERKQRSLVSKLKSLQPVEE